jgi:hypothetical protein
MKDDTRLFALAEGRSTGTASGTGTAGSTPSTTRRGTTVATCRTVAYRDASMAVTTSGAARTAGPGDDHATGVVALCTRVMLTSSSVGIIANSVVLAAWFAQRGSQPAAGITSSAEGWSVVSAFKLATSRMLPRLDPGPRSSRMMSFTPVNIHAG